MPSVQWGTYSHCAVLLTDYSALLVLVGHKSLFSSLCWRTNEPDTRKKKVLLSACMWTTAAHATASPESSHVGKVFGATCHSLSRRFPMGFSVPWAHLCNQDTMCRQEASKHLERPKKDIHLTVNVLFEKNTRNLQRPAFLLYSIATLTHQSSQTSKNHVFIQLRHNDSWHDFLHAEKTAQQQ